jgi:hypothetical protein
MSGGGVGGGRLSVTSAIALVQKATELFRKEPNMLELRWAVGVLHVLLV